MFISEYSNIYKHDLCGICSVQNSTTVSQNLCIWRHLKRGSINHWKFYCTTKKYLIDIKREKQWSKHLELRIQGPTLLLLSSLITWYIWYCYRKISNLLHHQSMYITKYMRIEHHSANNLDISATKNIKPEQCCEQE